MKNTFKILCLLLLASACLLQGCGGAFDKEDEKSDATTVETNVKHYYMSMEYAYATAVNEALLTTDLHADYLLLANKSFPLGEHYAPPNLVSLDSNVTYYGKSIELDSRAAAALYLMIQEMNAAGVTDIMVTSGYRTYQRQQQLFADYVALETKGISQEAIDCLGKDYIQKYYTDMGIGALSVTDAQTVVLTYSAAPGTSEHQTGLCVDFMTSTMSALDNSFADTDAFAWLVNNAYRFGFILRYPEGKESVTGYTYEPWHYRFVGREAATDIHFGNLTLEQYLGK